MKKKRKVGGVRKAAPVSKQQQELRDAAARYEEDKRKRREAELVLCAGSGVMVDRRLVCPDCGYHPGFAKTQHHPECPRWGNTNLGN